MFLWPAKHSYFVRIYVDNKRKMRMALFNMWMKMKSSKTVIQIHTLPVTLWQPADRHSEGQIKPPYKIISFIHIGMMMMCLWHKAETKHTVTRQENYVRRNIEVRLCNHCCSGKAMSITQPECVFVALGIQNEMRMYHIVVCGLPCSTIFFHIIS